MNLYQQYLTEVRITPPSQDLKKILSLAQQSQKSLQKLISKEEVEKYVNSWNPWEQKKVLFPLQNSKSNPRKRAHSPSQHYNNPEKWKRMAKIGEAIQKFYDGMN